MRVYQKPLIIILIFLLAGCATGSSIVTGTVRPAISADMVKIYLDPPAQYETIGIVEASSDVEFSTQAAQDRAIMELKSQAAKIGENGVLLISTGDGSGDMVGFVSGGVFFAEASETKTARGKAIFVSSE